MSILRSLIILCGVSATIGGIWYILGGSFAKPVFLSAILQVVCYVIWSSIQSDRVRITIEREHTKRVEEFAKQGLELECSYCSKLTIVPIRFDEDNQFECPHCNNLNSIYISVTTTQVTQPLPVARIMSNSYIQEAQQIRNAE